MRTIVITGGTSGLGKEVAKLFKLNGDEVFILGRTADETNPNEFICDVTNMEETTKVFQKIAETNPKIDILINSAGYGISGAAELNTPQEVQNMFDVNYFGLLNSTNSALPFMTKGSKIINISSCCGLFAMPFRIHYCASKSAVNMLSYGMRMELSDVKIQVCSVCPGDIQTNFTKNRIKNFQTNEKYGDRVENATGWVEKRNSKRMSVEYCAESLYKICNKKNLKPMKIIGKKYKMFYVLTKLFSINKFLKISNKLFGGHKKVK